jgi:hypothetical protein
LITIFGIVDVTRETDSAGEGYGLRISAPSAESVGLRTVMVRLGPDSLDLFRAERDVRR